MNRTRDTVMTTLKIATDVREKLQEWARYNLSSMTAELNRSVRERAEREGGGRRHRESEGREREGGEREQAPRRSGA